MDSLALASESLEWSAWLPDGLRNALRDGTEFFVALFGWFFWMTRPVVVTSLLVPLGLYLIYCDVPSAILAAKTLAMGWVAILVGLPMYMSLSLLLLLLTPKKFRIDSEGIKMDRTVTYKWAEIVDVRVRRSASLVPFVEVASASGKNSRVVRLAVPSDVSLQAVVATIEHWYGRPILCVHA